MLAGVFVAASDLTVVSTILPQIVFDLEIPLRTGLSQAAWIVNAYLIAYTLTLPLLGHVSDQFGGATPFWCACSCSSIQARWSRVPPISLGTHDRRPRRFRLSVRALWSR